MNSPRPEFDDDLGQEISNALHLKTRRHSPPDRTWRQIKKSAKSQNKPVLMPGKALTFRLSMVAQVVLVFVVLTVSGINLNSHFQSALPTVQGTEIRSVNEGQLTKLAMLPPVNDQDDHLLSKRFEIHTRSQKSDKVTNNNPPLVIPPDDVMPHMYSPEGRQYATQIEVPVPVSEDRVIFQIDPLASGPIQ